ncbi:hypothetical protein [Methylophilus methylotrophus]|uniref:hypothetical protein n=1 Tax=Methylophilus methylotrophus TaxID=17 RepID=UPI0012B5581A|nr:hypothetical protein [Methylophilus methylotrophus]
MNNILKIGTSFLLGVGAGLMIRNKDWHNFITSYIPALATLVAAYYGAKFAFEFQNQKELEIEKKNNLIAINKAIFTLSRMANDLFVYQRDYINLVRDEKEAFLKLRPTSQYDKELFKLDIESLSFLLNTDFRNLLSEIAIEGERYIAAIEAINLRSNIHLNEIQPKLENAGFKNGLSITISDADLELILGNRLLSMLKETTEQVITHVDSTIESLKLVADRLKDSMKTIYPDQKIITFNLPKSSK